MEFLFVSMSKTMVMTKHYNSYLFMISWIVNKLMTVVTLQ